MPLVVIGPSQYVKQGYLSHVAYTTNNVIAAMERTMENVKSGIIDPNDNIGLATFPMTTNDQAALGDPLEDFWVQGSTPLSASATASPTTGNAPLAVNFTGSATGGTAPYTYSWNFGDGSDEHRAEPQPHLQHCGHLHRDADRHRQRLAREHGHIAGHDHGQRRRQPVGGQRRPPSRPPVRCR